MMSVKEYSIDVNKSIEEILNLWNGITKSEQPDENIKNNPVDIFNLIFDT